MPVSVPRLATPPAHQLPPEVLTAAEALARGDFVLMYDQDGREEEVDLLVAAQHCTPEAVRRLRNDAGGLIFLAVDHEVGRRFDLPFAQDINEAASAQLPVLDHVITKGLPYDARSSFSLWVNHRDTRTGITDNDRSLTIRKIAEVANQVWDLPADEARRVFGENFRSPGHVSLCHGHQDGPLGRQGHTELGAALGRIAGVTPVLAGCEMLDDHTGGALSVSDAEKYAAQNGFPFLSGETLIEAYRQWAETTTRDA